MVASRRAATAAATAAAAAAAARNARSAAAAASTAGSGFSVSSAFPGTGSAAGALAATSPPGTEPIAQRSIFIHVRPPPVSMSERRSILRVLERYGKTEMFKKMAANDSFIAITSTAAMAAALIKRSPMQYEFLGETLQAARPWGRPGVAAFVHPVETAAGGGTGEGLDSPVTDRSGAAEYPGAEPTGASDADADPTSSACPSVPPIAHKSFVLSVFPSVDYHHRTMVRNNPLHGPWPREVDGRGSILSSSSSSSSSSFPSTEGSVTYKTTFVYNALRAVVPPSASSEALSDWRDHDSIHRAAAAAAAAATATTAKPTSQQQQQQQQKPSPGTRQSALAHIQQRKARRASRSLLANLAEKSVGGGAVSGKKPHEDR